MTTKRRGVLSRDKRERFCKSRDTGYHDHDEVESIERAVLLAAARRIGRNTRAGRIASAALREWAKELTR